MKDLALSGFKDIHVIDMGTVVMLSQVEYSRLTCCN